MENAPIGYVEFPIDFVVESCEKRLDDIEDRRKVLALEAYNFNLKKINERKENIKTFLDRIADKFKPTNSISIAENLNSLERWIARYDSWYAASIFIKQYLDILAACRVAKSSESTTILLSIEATYILDEHFVERISPITIYADAYYL